MGLLDSVIGGLMSGGSGASPSMGNLLSSLLGGGAQPGSPNAGQGGLGGAGLGGLLQQLQQAGLGDVAKSWVGNGPNQPITPNQLQNALGEEQVQGMARQTGMQTPDFLNQLAQHLPNAVDGMTPNGRLPDEGSVSV